MLLLGALAAADHHNKQKATKQLQTGSLLPTPRTFTTAPTPQGPPPGAIVFNPVQPTLPGAIVFNPTTAPTDRRTPIQKKQEELAKYGALVNLAGNVAGSLVPGLKPLQYAGDILNLLT